MMLRRQAAILVLGIALAAAADAAAYTVHGFNGAVEGCTPTARGAWTEYNCARMSADEFRQRIPTLATMTVGSLDRSATEETCSGTFKDGACARETVDAELPARRRHAARDEHAEDRCQRPIDIVFLVDGSGSVSSSEFDTTRAFVEDVGLAINIAPNATNAAIIQFSSTAQVEIGLTDSEPAFLAANAAMSRIAGGTNFVNAFNLARTVLEASPRPLSNSVIVLITDGVAPDPSSVVDPLKADGVTIVSVGVGSGVNVASITAIASDPSLVFLSPTFAALDALVDAVSGITVCDDEDACTRDICNADGSCSFEVDVTRVGQLDCPFKAPCAFAFFGWECITGAIDEDHRCVTVDGSPCAACPDNFGYDWEGDCRTDCTYCRHCAPGHYCIDNTCVPRRDTCAGCAYDTQCLSDVCLDGVCTDAAAPLDAPSC